MRRLIAWRRSASRSSTVSGRGGRIASARCRSQCSGRRDGYRLDRARTGDPRIEERQQLLGDAIVACADADRRDAMSSATSPQGSPNLRLAVLHHVRERLLELTALLVERRIRGERGGRAPAEEPPHLHQCRRRTGHRVRPPSDDQVVADDVLGPQRAERLRQLESDLRRPPCRHRRPSRIVGDRRTPVGALLVVSGDQRQQRVAADALVVLARQRPIAGR